MYFRNVYQYSCFENGETWPEIFLVGHVELNFKTDQSHLKFMLFLLYMCSLPILLLLFYLCLRIQNYSLINLSGDSRSSLSNSIFAQLQEYRHDIQGEEI